MSYVCVTTVLILSIVSTVCIASDMVNERFDIMLELAPKGEPYLTVSARSQIECSTICASDTYCMTVTTTTLGSGRAECQMFTCLEPRHMSHSVRVRSFRKKGEETSILLYHFKTVTKRQTPVTSYYCLQYVQTIFCLDWILHKQKILKNYITTSTKPLFF